MKELTIEEKAKRYDEAIERAKSLLSGNQLGDAWIYKLLPEVAENKGMDIRKWLIENIQETLAVDGFFEGQKTMAKAAIAWLENQAEQPNKVSIWKHWKDGIAGNSDDVPTYLIKRGMTYSLSSCLGFECDYIELSELDKLMVEKQGNQASSENPEKAPEPSTEETDMNEYQKGFECGKQRVLEYPEDFGLSKKLAWNAEDEVGLGDTLWALEQARTIAKDENDMGNLWYAEGWLKSLKERAQSQPEQEESEDATVNECVDLGLLSGTLWKSFNEDRYYTFDEANETFGSQLPTYKQWKELKDECKWEWNVAGYDVTGPNGNKIFLPAEGFSIGSRVWNVAGRGYYWSGASLNEALAYYLYFNNCDISVDSGFRDRGRSVRLVK